MRNVTLMKIAAIGGLITVGMGFAVRQKIGNNIRQTEYYRDALRILRADRGAVYLLGEPIKDCGIDIDDESKNWSQSLSAQYQVPVNGPKQRGILYFWAERASEEDKWIVNRMELELKSVTGKRLLIKTNVI